MTTARIEVPPKLRRVFTGAARYRAAYGGRGSGKTRTFALMSAVHGYRCGMSGQEGVILCAREHLNSLDESSMEEVKAAIRAVPWLAAYYEIGDRFIRSTDGRIRYAFAGLRVNLASVKSKSKLLLAWVDEAETVSESAWRTLLPRCARMIPRCGSLGIPRAAKAQRISAFAIRLPMASRSLK